MGKVWEKRYSKVTIFSKTLGATEIHTIPKTWEKRISIVLENMVKHSYFKFIGFLNISCEAQIHTIPKIWEK